MIIDYKLTIIIVKKNLIKVQVAVCTIFKSLFGKNFFIHLVGIRYCKHCSVEEN